MCVHNTFCFVLSRGLPHCRQARKLIGATNPLASAPGTIRYVVARGCVLRLLCPCRHPPTHSWPRLIRSGDYSIEVGRNVIHGSDSVENAQKELALWFPEGLVDNTPVLLGQVSCVGVLLNASRRLRLV